MIKRLFNIFLILIIVGISGCWLNSKRSLKQHKRIKHDLEEIKKDGVLRVITSNSSTSYFLYKGQPMGYEYDLLKRFAKHLDLDFQIVISNDIDTMFTKLLNGKVDLIAHGITVTNQRKQRVGFSDYLYLTHQVLVQRKPENWRKLKWSALQAALIHDVIELIGDTVSVRANSSYINRLSNLSEEIGGTIFIDTLPGDLSTDRIIEMVANGDIKYTVADNNIASISASYYPELDIRVPVSFSQRLAWAVRPQSEELLAELNAWIGTMKSGVEYYTIYNKYFKNERDFRSRGNSEYFSLNNNRISEYDDLIQESADTLGWDWRLLASMVYQESKFNPELESWAGAKGLMQLMPVTAERYGVNDRSDPVESISAATKVIRVLWNRFEDVPDSTNRIKFTMASYNCGYGHVLDAQALAKIDKLDPKVWDDNVAESMLKLSYPENYNKPIIKHGYVRGVEPFTYVKQVFDRYDRYIQLIE